VLIEPPVAAAHLQSFAKVGVTDAGASVCHRSVQDESVQMGREALFCWQLPGFARALLATGAVLDMSSKESEPDLVAVTMEDRRIRDLIEPSVVAMGFEIVRIRMIQTGQRTLQIMAERRSGGMPVDDCAILSREISALLDVADPIAGHYVLEISSPGIDRPLVRPADFDRWFGHEAKIELLTPHEGRKRFRGRLAGRAGAQVRLAMDDAKSEKLIGFAFTDIAQARLVLTDRLIEESLKGARH
jgi:ribosome maturation factor RimP